VDGVGGEVVAGNGGGAWHVQTNTVDMRRAGAGDVGGRERIFAGEYNSQ